MKQNRNASDATSLAAVLASYSAQFDDRDIERYRSDWSGQSGGKPFAVTRPTSVQQVAEIVVACKQAGKAVTVQGGRATASKLNEFQCVRKRG